MVRRRNIGNHFLNRSQGLRLLTIYIPVEFKIKGQLRTVSDESLVYTVTPFKTSEQDMQALRADPMFVPAPVLHEGSSFCFHVPLNDNLR